MLRVAFAGTPEFAVPTLRALVRSPHRLVGVLTQPDRPAGRGRTLTASPVKQAALELGLPVLQPERLRSPEERAGLAALEPEALIVVAYGLILPPAVLTLPRLGCINVHASLLPRWRGAAPIQRAILAGDVETGISIMQMEAGLDTGPVLAQTRLDIGRHSAAELHLLLAAAGAQLLVDTLAQVESGAARSQAQDDRLATYAPKILKSEARIDWSQSAELIARRVRAFDPWPVAETGWRGERLRLWEAQVLEGGPDASAGPPPPNPAGTLLGLQGELLRVQCGAGVLGVARLQLPGRRVIGAREFAAAANLTGTRLE